jgi:hypothetical protein
MDIAVREIRRDWIDNKHMKAFNFYKEDEMEEVDIIIDSPVQYPKAKKDAIMVKTGALKIPVISVKNLIKMKKDTGRPQDRLDIDSLKSIGRFKRKLK